MTEEKNNFFKNLNPNDDSNGDLVKWFLVSFLVSCVLIGLTFALTTKRSEPEIADKEQKAVNKVAAVPKEIKKEKKDVEKVDPKEGVYIKPVRSFWKSPFDKKMENILLLGVDSNGTGTDPFKNTRSDTMIVFNLDHKTKTINAVSIPRDSKVYIAEKNYIDKINAAHALGGPKLTINTIEQTFGIKIDHYVVVNFNGVRNLVDAIGGVPVDIKKHMYYVDHAADLYIDLQPGKQVLSSKTAEQYLRFRHDHLGDIGRVKRQQHFLQGVAQRFQYPAIIPRMPNIIKIATESIKTDMTPVDMAKYASMVKSIRFDKTQIATLPGSPNESGFASYWILDPQKTQDLIDRMIYRVSPAEAKAHVKASLTYRSEISDKVDLIKEKLQKEGYDIVCTYKTKEQFPQVIAHTNNVSFNRVNHLTKKIPYLKNAQHVVAYSGYRCADAEMTFVITGN